ncbi:MAG: efflux RND transporter periplasmic adaptor subunit [Gallionella sp.]|nr:efflux RND transporter periplasmic adaptor subunit [Gallionella sp.]
MIVEMALEKSVLNSNKTLWLKSGLVLAVLLSVAGCGADDKANAVPAAGKPALTVVTTTLKPAQWMQTLSASGSVVAWQEAVIGAEVTGVRIAEVRANVGDRVSKGQVLAILASDTMKANEAESQAALRESEALLAEASAHVVRTRKLAKSGFVSAQQEEQAVTAENTARARMEVQRARHQNSAQRLAQQHITAPDAGVISARQATAGTLTQPGVELFRLIRQGRLEWHAELTADELGLIRKGMKVELISAQGRVVHGVVSAIGPAINPQTRYGQVIVSLSPLSNSLPQAGESTNVKSEFQTRQSELIAGMFARGRFQLGPQSASVLPQSAVVLKDAAAYVFVVDASSRVSERKVNVGRRHGEQIQITGGLEEGVAVVESGGAFLVDGDLVRLAGPVK